jgi:hypothetical protein
VLLLCLRQWHASQSAAFDDAKVTHPLRIARDDREHQCHERTDSSRSCSEKYDSARRSTATEDQLTEVFIECK